MADSYLLEAICLLNYSNMCVLAYYWPAVCFFDLNIWEWVRVFTSKWHVCKWSDRRSNFWAEMSNRKPVILVPVLHTDLGACVLQTQPPQCHFTLRSCSCPSRSVPSNEADRKPLTTAAATLSQTVEYTLDKLSTKKTHQYSISQMGH